MQVSFKSAIQYLHFKQIYKDYLLKIDQISDSNVTKKLTIYSKTKALPILSYKGSPLDTLNQLLPIHIEEFVNIFRLRDMDHELCAFNTHSWFYSGDNIKSLEEFDHEYKYARRNNSDLRPFFPLRGAVKTKQMSYHAQNWFLQMNIWQKYIRLVSDLAFVNASCDKSSITLIQYRQLSCTCYDLPHITINSFFRWIFFYFLIIECPKGILLKFLVDDFERVNESSFKLKFIRRLHPEYVTELLIDDPNYNISLKKIGERSFTIFVTTEDSPPDILLWHFILNEISLI